MEQNYFDFIICGGGASGLLLLKALREDNFFNQYSILLIEKDVKNKNDSCLLYTSPSPRDRQKSRMPSSA